jgi:hypothetical protein
MAMPPWVNAFVSKLKSDLHVPLALLVFGTVSVYHMVTHRDLGPNYTSAVNMTYAFLGGHGAVGLIGDAFGKNGNGGSPPDGGQ